MLKLSPTVTSEAEASFCINTAEIERLLKEKEAAEKKLQQINGKLNNPGFLAKAPANVIETQKADAEKLTEKIKMIDESLAALL